MPKKFENPITGDYRGYKIRAYNKIQIRVSAPEYKKFIDLKIDKNMTAREAVSEMKTLCIPCNQIGILKK